MIYKLIVAYCANKGIGKDNTLPWNIRSDLIKFSQLTKGSGNNAIVMGKNTWLSIPKAPLPGRENLILSKSLKMSDLPGGNRKNVRIFKNFEDLNLYCGEKFEEIWIIGGSRVYQDFLHKDLIQEMHVTYIDKEFDCDTFFPDFDERKWSIKSEQHKSRETHDFNIYNQVYIREKMDD
jgi:dihydrofolate reductase